MKFQDREITDLEVDGVDPRDYPDFCEAYISFARWADTGEALADEELNKLNEECQDLAYELAYQQCVGFAG
jgi:hypothetical protein